MPESDARRDDIDELLRAADTATRLTRQLLTFSRQKPTEKRPIDINQSIAACLNMLRRSVGRQINIETTPSLQPPIVRMDPVQIDQVLLNLALNARDAMPAGGQLTLEVSCSPANGAAPSFVRLMVSDTGDGMDRETMSRAFEPFFTTKSAGKGTGLLVVEDNPALRRAMARMLESAGYMVTQTENGDEAIEQIDAPGSHFDLIVTDLVMPAKRAGCSRTRQEVGSESKGCLYLRVF